MNRHETRAQAANLRRANERLRGEMRAFYNRVDDWHESNKPDTVRCTKGCAACCQQLIVSTLPEARHVVAARPALVESVLPTLIEQDALGGRLSAGLGDVVRDPVARQELCERWWDAKQMCVFLSADNECKIYADRPYACRSYFVTSDPQSCGGERGQTVNIWSPPTKDSGHQELFEMSAKREGGEVVLGSLPALLLYAWRHR
jgi:Fe-S-cluster containining protein